MGSTSQPVQGTAPFRPRSAAYLADPYAQLRSLREQGPCWIDPGTGLWFLLDHEHVELGVDRISRCHRGQGLCSGVGTKVSGEGHGHIL